MRNTIKSNNGGYDVQIFFGRKDGKLTGKTFGKVYDGGYYLFTGEVKALADYKAEKEYNEYFVKYEVFTTKDGRQFIYWSDLEIAADYITSVEA